MSLFGDEPTQGAKASASGRFAEQRLEGAFSAYGIRSVNDNPEYHYENFIPRSDSLLIRQVVLPGYGRIDFLFKNFKTGLTLPIECKNQMGSGTADEKLAYTVEKLVKCGHSSFWLVLEGEGFKQEVIKHISSKIKNLVEKEHIKGRLIYGFLLQRAVEGLVYRDKIL